MSAPTPATCLPKATASADAPLSVVCLCAAWCGVCRQYESEFRALQARFPHVRFDWVDVEDEEARIGDVDVETFPTLLLGRGDGALFLGPLLPQIKVLERLIASFVDGAPATATLPEQAHGLWRRIAEKWQ
ncbi:MAG: thioredoxin family protein [Comamonadaceae bacterium]|nr:thioredoxin family protein [Comamonadaceae bacterium]